MFLSAPHSVGNARSAEWPSFRGPRHCGQLSADAGRANPAIRSMGTRIRRYTKASDEWFGGGGTGRRSKAGLDYLHWFYGPPEWPGSRR